MAKSSKEKAIEAIMEIIKNNNDDMKTGISWRNEIFSGSIHRIFIDDNGSLKFEGPLYKRRNFSSSTFTRSNQSSIPYGRRKLAKNS